MTAHPKQVIPTSPEALSELTKQVESYLVASAILLPRGIPRAAGVVSGSDFLDAYQLGPLWDVLVDMSNAGQPINDASIEREAIRRRIMTRDEIAKLIQLLPNGAMLLNHADEVRRLADNRRLFAAAEHVLRAAKEPDANTIDILERFKAYTDGVGTNRDAGFVHLSEALKLVVDRAENPESWTAWGTPYQRFNEKMGGGLQPKQVWLLGARTGRGKTAIAMNLAAHFAASGLAVWYSSLEMGNTELAERYASMMQRIMLHKWRPMNGATRLSSGEIASVKGEAEQSKRIRFWLTDQGVETVLTIKAKASLRRSLDGLDVLIVDNLNIMTPTNPSLPRHEQLKEMAVAFKRMAKELNIGIVLLAQLAVDAEPAAKQKETPSNRWWADSKRIIDDVDLAAILHQPNPDNRQAYELHVTKARAAPHDVFPLGFEGEYQTFTEVAADNTPSEYATDFSQWGGRG